jgi:tetratricopeptide (TPR) repeat protein
MENLSGDASVGWVGRALSEAVAGGLSGAGQPRVVSPSAIHALDRALGARPISAPGVSAESDQALAAGATLLAYGDYTVRNGKLEVRLTLEDARTLKVTRVIEVSRPAADVLGAASEIARRISPRATPYGTRNPQALEAYAKALEATDPAVMEAGFGVAIAADPDFVPPYRQLAQLKAQQQDRPGALAIVERAVERARARGNAIPELERARLELESAELAGNPDARRDALTKLVKLDPADSTAWRALGDSLMSRHQFRQAQDAYRQASLLAPDDVSLLNALGYAAGQAGDLDAATSALRRYQALRPNEANPLDSLGDVHFAAGRLADAESFYLQAAKKDPRFQNNATLLKAALAHLLTGDVPGANLLAEQYLAARSEAKDPVVDYRRAQLTWTSGRRKEAAQQMGAFALAAETGPLREIASRAYAELAIWSVQSGDRQGAAGLAQKALSIAGPASAGNALVARFLASPPASSTEWAVRAEQQLPGPAQGGIRNFALAYALLVDRQFEPARLLFRQMWDSGSPTADEGLPVLLAWCELETGRVKEAGPLLAENPIPSSNGLTPYTGFYIPRLLYLRGLLAEKEGRATDARAYYDKFLNLSGPDPLLWGEEKKARR